MNTGKMNSYPGNRHHQRMMPLDLSYNNHVSQSQPNMHYKNSGDEYYNNYALAPLTYYDMDTGQQSFSAAELNSHNVLLPPLTRLPASLPQGARKMVRLNHTESLNVHDKSSTEVRTSPVKNPSTSMLKWPDITGDQQSTSDFGCLSSPVVTLSDCAISSVSTRTLDLAAPRTPKQSLPASNKRPVIPHEDYDVNDLINNIVMTAINAVEPTTEKTRQHQESSKETHLTPRRRRNVERYQVIHNYRGKKKFIIDSPQPAERQRKKQSKVEKINRSVVSPDTVTPRKSPTGKSSRSISFSKPPAREKIHMTIMVPDSTTESPISTPMHDDISEPCSVISQLPCSEMLKLKPQPVKKVNKPNLLSIEDEVTIIKQAELNQRAQANRLPDLISDTASNHPIGDNSNSPVDEQPSVAKLPSPIAKLPSPVDGPPSPVDEPPSPVDEPPSPVDEPPSPVDEPPSLLRGRRRVCQTNFFQVVYPQPKRRKSADRHDNKKSKSSKPCDSLTTTRKGWKGKANLVKPAINLNTQLDVVSSKPADIGNQTTTVQDNSKPNNSTRETTDKDKKKKEVEKEEVEKEEELGEGRSVGRVVWGKLTARCKAWPGLTIKGSTAAQSPASPDHQWVFWYGEHKVSEVQICRLQDFDIGFKTAFKIGSGALYTTAVMEALTDSWVLLQGTEPIPTPTAAPEGLDEYLQWVSDTFHTEQSILPQGKVTKSVGTKLAEIVEMINNAEDSTDNEVDDNDEDYDERRRTPTSKSKKVAENNPNTKTKISRADATINIRAGDVDIEDVCLSCGAGAGATPHTRLQPHPLFSGGVCDDCLEDVKSSFFSFGADGCMSYCVICGKGGSLLVCDSQTCGRTYCKLCIEQLGNENLLTTVEESNPWACFLCEPVISNDVLLQSRDDWKQRLMRFYQKPSKLHNLPVCKPDRKLRVLSLFDGIGTAKVVLKNLNLDVEVYYSLEIEDDAIQVVSLNHGDDVIQLGDIRSLTEEKLAELGRIDLLVGGSPCNDLALVNPARKGLYDATGTGILFFDFYRILMTLMSRQPDHSVLWLFENVVHMNKETKATISRFLECEPVKLDAGVFSAQSRSRYFWGNIPGMFTPVTEDMKALNVSLQDVLSRGREAAVTKIRTVTTRGASLLQGKNEDMHAVVMNGHSDKLWPTELERVFGLPVHYTDAGNLAPGKRQKLLGRSWCVPVIEHLLKPLTHLFAVKSTPPKKQCCSSCICTKR